jgi:thioredoxin reductase
MTQLAAAGIRVEVRRIARVVAANAQANEQTSDQANDQTAGRLTLDRIEFVEGAPLERDALFVRPAQRQIPLVASLGLTLDAAGFVQVAQPTLATSIPGIYAAGDLITPAQGALIAAASGTFTAAMLNRSLAAELVVQGALA